MTLRNPKMVEFGPNFGFCSVSRLKAMISVLYLATNGSDDATYTRSRNYDPLGQIDQPLERFCLVNPQFDRLNPALPDSNPGEL